LSAHHLYPRLRYYSNQTKAPASKSRLGSELSKVQEVPAAAVTGETTSAPDGSGSKKKGKKSTAHKYLLKRQAKRAKQQAEAAAAATAEQPASSQQAASDEAQPGPKKEQRGKGSKAAFKALVSGDNTPNERQTVDNGASNKESTTPNGKPAVIRHETQRPPPQFLANIKNLRKQLEVEIARAKAQTESPAAKKSKTFGDSGSIADDTTAGARTEASPDVKTSTSGSTSTKATTKTTTKATTKVATKAATKATTKATTKDATKDATKEAQKKSAPTPKKKAKKKGKEKFVPATVEANDLALVPVDRPQPPVPGLAYGLDRVLFNPGVYHLQDPRSRVYNFDPYLAGIMPVKEFDFGALRQYITSSKDRTLANIAAEAGKKYAGSTSSMTSMLSHFHYLLSNWRPINPSHVSRGFPVESTNFTRIGRAPAAIFLHYQDGTYAIDADKEFDSANVLSMLGKSMEKLLTLPKQDFEKYRRVNSDQLTEEERNSDESYHYTTMGDFMMRSQLDAHDPRIPGTGMFDLKTRAVVTIRMDAQDYHKGLGYEIRQRFGEWESYEREYYDMIRSAFMKYSLQVRMGRMDGIFVAFHNTQRIFGFQYISLPEMDNALHGTANMTLGNHEFKLSLHLLNKLLDKATKRFPGKSLRLHFETRPADVPVMYVFAKPVTQEQIEEVQNKNKAQVEAFERNMMGLNPEVKDEVEDETPPVQEDEKGPEEDEETSLDVWEDMRLKVEEVLENDEQGENFVRDAIEDALEESGLLRTESVEEKQRYLNALMKAVVSEGEAEEVDDANKNTGELSIGGDGHDSSEAVQDTPIQTEPVEEADTRRPDIQEAEQESAGQELVESEADGDAVPHEPDASSKQPPLKDLIIRLAAKSRASSTGHGENSPNQKDDESSDWQRLRRFEEILHQMVEKTQEPAVSPPPEQSSSDEDLSTTAQTPPSEEPSQEDSSDAATSQESPSSDPTPASEPIDTIAKGEEVMGMIVTIRNKVDGKFVPRPEDLTKKSSWVVHYAIEELAKDRASRLYAQTVERRRKAMEKTTDTGEWSNRFKGKLDELSKKGRGFRRVENDKAKLYPVYVYGSDKPLKWEEVFSDQGEPLAPKKPETE
jgi:hypothetical protein